jgi:hypothetical protein
MDTPNSLPFYFVSRVVQNMGLTAEEIEARDARIDAVGGQRPLRPDEIRARSRSAEL